ncbi:hypothetical protein MKW98_009596 [Papaver atlanticum]|uniref:Exocyst subunit Exo70 family protein n=1 Tax=Papaver atlanticum TaxID=357466 RepID=A0AAD4XDF0_9MAGN|nr:hypothetical protein MKW98_009596 [Papaver atlanticum]
MAKLEEEFTDILVRRNQPFEPDYMSFHSSDVGTMDGISICSFELDQSLVESPPRSSSTYPGEIIIDLVHQNAIPDLNRIECCEAYINVRKEALADCLFMLEVDNLIFDLGEVALHTEKEGKLEPEHVGEATLYTEISKIKEGKRDASIILKIKKWNRAMKILTSVYIANEKQLCDRVFGEFRSVSSTCLVKIFEVPMLQLLKYGEAIIGEGRELEKLFLRLYMYEVLRDLLPDIDNMFSEEAGSSVRFVFREVLKRSGDSVRETVLKFEKAIGSSILTKPLAGGGVCLLSNYVMAYITALAPYSELLEEKENEGASSSNEHSLAYHLKLVASNLKSNLDIKSLLYTDDALRYIFLMNNIFYMKFFGDHWIRQHVAEYRGYAMDYERATWLPILNLLIDEGMFIRGSHSVSRRVVKERLKDFNLSFEKVYESQTAWLIPDPQLREELRISVSSNVVQAYRTFVGRHTGRFSATSIGKLIKHNADGLQTYIFDLFGGSPKSLPNFART